MGAVGALVGPLGGALLGATVGAVGALVGAAVRHTPHKAGHWSLMPKYSLSSHIYDSL